MRTAYRKPNSCISATSFSIGASCSTRLSSGRSGCWKGNLGSKVQTSRWVSMIGGGCCAPATVVAAWARNCLRVLLGRGIFPVLAVHAVQVPDDFTVTERHLANQLACAAHAQVRGIDESKIACHQPQYCEIRRRSHRQVAQFLVMN